MLGTFFLRAGCLYLLSFHVGRRLCAFSLAPFDLLDSASWEAVPFKTFVLLALAPVVCKGELRTLRFGQLICPSKVVSFMYKTDSFCTSYLHKFHFLRSELLQTQFSLFQSVSWHGPSDFHSLSISSEALLCLSLFGYRTRTVVLAGRWKSVSVFSLKSFTYFLENLYVLALLVTF